MAKRKGLGRGLGALIPSESESVSQVDADVLRTVPITEIRPNPHQPRTDFDPDLLEELAESIKEHGLIQPLIVTEDRPHRYTLIAGERRWRAAQLAKLSELTVVVREATPQAMFELAIIENIQREDLSPIEEALAYQRLMDEFDLTQEQVKQRMSKFGKAKARSTIANLVRLLELPAEIQEAINNGLISGRHGRELLRLDQKPDDQLSAFKSVVRLGLTVKQTVSLVDGLVNQKPKSTRPQKRMDPHLADLQQSFREALGYRVDLAKSGKGGKIVIHYDSDDDLNDIFDHISKNQ